MSRKAAVFAAAFTLLLALGSMTPAVAGACLPKAEKPSEGTGLAVSIVSCAFGPTILHAPVGGTITWTNADYLPHAVAGAGWVANSEAFGSFDPGSSVSYTFTAPGIYQYMCHLHPGMAGVVVVGDVAFPGAGSAPTAPVTRPAPLPSGANAPVELPIALALVIGAVLGSIATARWPRRWRVALPSWSA